MNYTSDEMSDLMVILVKEIKAKLQVDKTILSKTVRKRISVPDERPSARMMGGGSIAILVVSFVVLIGFDVIHILNDLVYGPWRRS